MWLLMLNLASKYWWLTVWARSVNDTNPIILTTEGLTSIANFVSFGSYQPNYKNICCYPLIKMRR